MYAASLFNEQQGNNIDSIYGIVTTGYDWLFLKLNNHILSVDSDRYFLNNLPELLGCWQNIIDDM
jgi:hypothetical protein